MGITADEIATIVADTLMREPGLPFEVTQRRPVASSR